MNKNIFVLIAIFITVTAVLMGCKKTPPGPQNTPTVALTVSSTITQTGTITQTVTITPTVTATSTTEGTITGNLVLPSVQSGIQYIVLVDNDLNFANGVVNMAVGNCGGSVNVPYSVTAPAGSYYVYAVVKTLSPAQTPPQAGDYVGSVGALWPSSPGFANVPVTGGNSTVNQDITMVLAADNVHGTLTLPANAEGLNYLIMMDDDGNGGNGGVDYLKISTITGSSGTTYPYSALVLFPGAWYITAQVDVNSSGLPGNPAGGDYVWAVGPYTMDPTLANGPYDITLITIP